MLLTIAVLHFFCFYTFRAVADAIPAARSLGCVDSVLYNKSLGTCKALDLKCICEQNASEAFWNKEFYGLLWEECNDTDKISFVHIFTDTCNAAHKDAYIPDQWLRLTATSTEREAPKSTNASASTTVVQATLTRTTVVMAPTLLVTPTSSASPSSAGQQSSLSMSMSIPPSPSLSTPAKITITWEATPSFSFDPLPPTSSLPTPAPTPNPKAHGLSADTRWSIGVGASVALFVLGLAIVLFVRSRRKKGKEKKSEVVREMDSLDPSSLASTRAMYPKDERKDGEARPVVELDGTNEVGHGARV
ncbi:hypothetical protein K491DRAFT_782565 [Lophiostoma macrostomum CBS 122681]|uniref:Extracellular membrane protein CFEM domain-containing protein n=1 Tax=Lophiostoma macrostomum CBS 122681 TaxID=1314788 RepID=A0A6A6SVA6_9PLEO|nr:hypothetical protein K491DRAFT_782565 [Lophiostoma macrostomum CBS 122681]